MTISWSLVTGLRRYAFFFIVLVTIASCGQSSQPTTSVKPPPTVEPTATTKPSPTLEPTIPPTQTTTPQPVISLDLDLPEGDPDSGLSPARSYGCFGCHADPNYDTFGPSFESSDGMPAIARRGKFRIADPEYEGNASSDLEYVIESIILPEAYIVEGEWEEAMPKHYGATVDNQDLADIIAWMATFED